MVDDSNYEEDASRSRYVLEESVFLNLLRVHHRLKKDQRTFFEQYDLTHRQYNVLRILYVGGREGLSCQTIRERLVTNVSDISRLIDRLAEKDLVTRQRSDEDRRVVLIHLTEEGEQLTHTVGEKLIDFHQQQFENVEEETVQQLNDLLEDVLDQLEVDD